MREHLEKCGTSVEFGSELRTFTQFEDRVTAEIVKRDSTGKETIEKEDFAWLIGADGARSVVRKTLGVSFLGETKDDEEAVLADLRINSPQSEVRSDSSLPTVYAKLHARSFGICGVAGKRNCMSLKGLCAYTPL